MWQSPEQHIVSERSHEVIVLTCDSYKGHDLLNIRKRFLSRDGKECWSKSGIALHPDEAYELQRILCQVLGPSEPVENNVSPKGDSMPPSHRAPGNSHLALQDRLLLHLAEGLAPDDFHVGGVQTRTRITELGKALRRAGYLAPKEWTLTTQGTMRVEMLHEGHSRRDTAKINPDQEPVGQPTLF